MLDFKGDRMLFKEPAANVFFSLAIIGGLILFLDEVFLSRVGQDWERYAEDSGELFSEPFEVNAYGTGDAAIEAMAMADTLASLIG